MKAAKEQIVRSVFMQKEADKALTDEVLQKAYEEYKNNFPNVDEIKARHILVKEEAQAKEIIEKLSQGGDFAALAKEFSIDATKERGGELNYFVKQEVVPEFGDAVFAMKPKDVSKKPVKSPFGYHVIEVLDMRKRQAPTFEQAKPFIAAQLRGQALNAVVSKWRSEANVQLFDINGNPVKADAPKAEDKEG
jgi:peptidyl-prolyl cis-trans isomerase C